MWSLRWKGDQGETRTCSIDEEYVRDVIISICQAGAFLDEIEVSSPNGRVQAASILME